jgi:hypothetical protein
MASVSSNPLATGPLDVKARYKQTAIGISWVIVHTNWAEVRRGLDLRRNASSVNQRTVCFGLRFNSDDA